MKKTAKDWWIERQQKPGSQCSMSKPLHQNARLDQVEQDVQHGLKAFAWDGDKSARRPVPGRRAEPEAESAIARRAVNQLVVALVDEHEFTRACISISLTTLCSDIEVVSFA